MKSSDRTPHRANLLPIGNQSLLHRKRSVVESGEDEDAVLTGMTRSLDRRLLALNLQPVMSRLPGIVPKAA